jgi:hypothetical protein
LIQDTPANVLAVSAVYRFLAGASLAALTKPKWLIVLAWMELALVTMALGLALAIMSLAGSSP